MAGITFTYNPRSRRYHASNGRFLSAKEVRGAIDAVVAAETAKIRGVAQSLVDGKITLSEWQLQTEQLLKALHVAMALAANGGVKNTSAGDMGYIGSQIKAQYQYLRSFAKQIRTGQQPLDGTLVARAALYAQSARGTYEQVARRSAQNTGQVVEKRVLGPADHCGGPSGCVALAARGWQLIGSLPPIGDTPCGANCHCSFIFSSSVDSTS